jgi:hypothetical protein
MGTEEMEWVIGAEEPFVRLGMVRKEFESCGYKGSEWQEGYLDE